MIGYLTAMRKYATFSGRASRQEYWMFVLIVVVLFIVCFVLDPSLGIYVLQGVFETSSSADFNGTVLASQHHDGIGILTLLVYLVHLLPAFAAAVRRLHDGDKSGWFLLLSFIPFVNFYFLYLLIKQGTLGPNRFGPSPLNVIQLPSAARA